MRRFGRNCRESFRPPIFSHSQILDTTFRVVRLEETRICLDCFYDQKSTCKFIESCWLNSDLRNCSARSGVLCVTAPFWSGLRAVKRTGSDLAAFGAARSSSLSSSETGDCELNEASLSGTRRGRQLLGHRKPNFATGQTPQNTWRGATR